MRKGLVVALVTAALVFGVAVGASADSIRKSITVDYSGIKIRVNGTALSTDKSEPFVVVDEGRTYVPARYLAEALGAKVNWEADTNSVAVVTADYIEQVKDGNTTTYKLPYFGASIRVPSGLTSVADGTNLLNLAAPDRGIVVNPTPFQAALGFDGMVDLSLRQMKALGMLGAASDPKALTVPGATNAVEVTGMLVVNNLKYPARLRLVADSQAFWILLARYDAASDPNGAKAGAILDTFTLGQ